MTDLREAPAVQDPREGPVVFDPRKAHQSTRQRETPYRREPEHGATVDSLLPTRYLGVPGVDRPVGGRGVASWPRRKVVRAVLVAPTLLTLYICWSLLGAVATPGNQNFQAKWMDWFRSHDAAFAVNAVENFYYSHKAPAKGGNPDGLNSLPESSAAGIGLAKGALPPPKPVPLVVQPGLKGEGQWRPVGPTVSGTPSMFVSQFRADQTYTSQLTSAVWIDPHVSTVGLTPGSSEPGGTPTYPPQVTPAQMPTIAAAFNGGFRFKDANGGFYLDGRTLIPLHDGAASIVLFKNGAVDIGTWNSEVKMSKNVKAVLQNLVPLVDHGQLSPAANNTDSKIWGHTLGSKVVVPRSGVGVTATGALVYVAGPALTAQTLAESLQRAGSVRALALDLNPEWVTFNFFDHGPGGAVQGTKLFPQMHRPANRYLGPDSRDFFTVTVP